MPRDRRIFETGHIYHLTPTGNDERDVFVDDADRANFLDRIATVMPRHEIEVLGYCLMRNHVHLLVVVAGPGEALSAAMQILLGSYARWWNQHQDRSGHLFEARFCDEPVKTDRHLLAAARYIDLNPVAARLHAEPGEYEWSSYRAHIGASHPPAFLANSRFLRLVGTTPDRARSAYEAFVRDRLAGPEWPPPRKRRRR
jgi:putative transposase